MKDFTNALCSSDQLFSDIVVHHQHCFGALYASTKNNRMLLHTSSLNGTSTAACFF